MIFNRSARFDAAIAYVIATVTCCGVTVICLHLWQANLRYPLQYGGGDELAVELFIKGLIENPWYFKNSSLAMPFGQDLSALPLPDAFNLSLLKLIGFCTHGYGRVINVFYLLTFPATTLATTYALRQLNIRWAGAVCGGLLYTFIPYHFYRGESHLFLSAYYVLPFTVVLMFRIFSAEQVFVAPVPSWRLRRNRSAIEAAIVCLVTGSIGIGYYPFFACFFILCSTAAAWIRYRRVAQVIDGAVSIALVAVSFGLNLLPAFLSTHRSGGYIFERSPADAETYGLKIAQMVLPIDSHRLPAFAALKSRYAQAPLVNENTTAALGFVGSAGFLFLLGWLVYRLLKPNDAQQSRRSCSLVDFLALNTLAGTLLGTIGGFGSIVALVVTAQVRSYNRISIYLGLFAITAVSLLVSRIEAGIISRPGRRAYWLGLAVLMFVALWDQTTNAFVPQYAVVKAAFNSDEKIVREIEGRVPPGAMVFQLPYIAYPESAGKNDMSGYDLARGYLHSRQLRWSYGAWKGGIADAWQEIVSSQPADRMIDTLALNDFDAVYIDRFGYSDRAKQFEQELSDKLASSKAILADNGRLVVYDLSRYRQSMRSSIAATEWEVRRGSAKLIVPIFGKGFYNEERDSQNVWRWSRAASTLRIVNLADRNRKAQLQFSVVSLRPTQIEMTSGALSRGLTADATPRQVRQDIDIPAGETVINFGSRATTPAAADDRRELAFALYNLIITAESPDPSQR